MMQFVAPVQLFLMLWLFAATAPAATALVNGSLDALIDAHTIGHRDTNHQDKQAPEEFNASRRIAYSHADLAQLILLALSEQVAIFQTPTQVRSTTVIHEAPLALSSSILHTEVQRHRPRWV